MKPLQFTKLSERYTYLYNVGHRSNPYIIIYYKQTTIL